MTAVKPNRRVTRLVYGVFVAITTVFVGSLIVQVAMQVFAGDARRAEVVSPECGRGLRELSAAVNRALAVGLGAEDADAALARYRQTRDEAWTTKDGIAATCAAEPHGSEAMAALARLDRQAEGIVRRQTAELRTVRREVDSFIR